MAKILYTDGPDGSGKTVLVQKLKKKLESQGHKVYITKEPGGETFGPVRELLQNPNDVVHDISRRILFFANHIQVLGEIQKIINDYDYIIIDRMSFVSDRVYGCNLGKYNELSSKMLDEFMDMTQSIYKECFGDFINEETQINLIFIDINDNLLRKRIGERKSSNDLNDNKNMDFKIKVNHIYKDVVKEIEKYNDDFVIRFNPSTDKVTDLISKIENGGN